MGIFAKNVLATVTEEELEKFVGVSLKIKAIEKMQESLTEQMRDTLKERRELWKEMYVKYNLEGSLQMDEENGKITKYTS